MADEHSDDEVLDAERDTVHRGRHTVTGTVGVLDVPIEDGEVHHIDGTVEIEVAGASGERAHTTALVEQIEAAVVDAVETYEPPEDGDDAEHRLAGAERNGEPLDYEGAEPATVPNDAERDANGEAVFDTEGDDA